MGGRSLDLVSLGSIVQDVLYKVDRLPGDEELADVLEKAVRGRRRRGQFFCSV